MTRPSNRRLVCMWFLQWMLSKQAQIQISLRGWLWLKEAERVVPAIRRSQVRFPGSPGYTSSYPWARYWTPNSWLAGWHFAWQPLPSSVWMCVNVTSVVKRFELSINWKSAIEMQVHLPIHHLLMLESTFCGSLPRWRSAVFFNLVSQWRSRRTLHARFLSDSDELK